MMKTTMQAPAGPHHTMLAQSAGCLTNHFLKFAAEDLDQVQTHLHRTHGSISLSVEQPSRFIGYREVLLTLEDLVLTLGCVNSGAGYDLSFRSGDEYIVTIPLRGCGWAATGQIVVEYGHQDIMIVSPACGVHKHWDGPSEVLSLHIPSHRLQNCPEWAQLAQMVQAPICKIPTKRLSSFLRMLDMLCRDLTERLGASPFLRQPLAGQIADALLNVLIEDLRQAVPTPREAAPPSPVVPYYVKRAEEFIVANAHLSIGIEDIAAAAGVSLRTIQYGFRTYRNTTPMVWLKQRRYLRARELLLAGEGRRRSIGDVAADVGFGNVCQFSRDYRALFHETPSQTAARPRRLVS